MERLFLQIQSWIFTILLGFFSVHCVQVKFETDCDRDFFVSDLDVYTLKGDPNPNVVGGASACEKRFNSNSKFKIYIQSFNTEDCAVTLYFHENDPTLKNPKWQLSCNAPVGSTLQTTTGNLVVRLVKPSGSASSYRFTILLTTEKGQLPTNTVGETAGGGVSTVVAIGIGVGVAAFLIIIIAVVCFFVCRQVNEQKKERMQQLQPSVFTTPGSNPSVIIEHEGDRNRYREDIERYEGSYSKRHRPGYHSEEDHYTTPKLPEPKVNGILKASPRRSRKRGKAGGEGVDNEGYSASVSSTDDSCDFDFESYQKSIQKGLPNSQSAKHFSLDPDPSRARRERQERKGRSSSQTSDSSADDFGYTNKAFTDESGKASSVGKVSGRRHLNSESSKRTNDDYETATNYSRSTRTGSFRSRSYSPSRTEGSSDTGNYESRFERNPNAASIRRSRSRSASRSSTKSAASRKMRHQDHSNHAHDQTDQSQASHRSHGHSSHGHGSHGHGSHSRRSRSRDRQKKSANLPIFDEVKKMQKGQRR